MQSKEAERILCDEIAVILGCDAAALDPAAALHTMGVDSMSFVELLVFIEKRFGLKLMESDLTKEDFRSIRALASRIAAALPAP